MARILKSKSTNNYVFTIERIIKREIPEEDRWNMEHGIGHMERAPKMRDEIVWRGQYEIADEAVIKILQAVLSLLEEKK